MADPVLKFEPSFTAALHGRLVVSGVTTNYTIHYGDGMAHAGKPNQYHDWVWPSPGPYTAVLVRDGERHPYLKCAFRVLPQPASNVTLEPSPDDDYTARLTFTDPVDQPVGRFNITWERGGTPQDVLGVPGTWVDHYYGSAGLKHVQVIDHWSWLRRVENVTLVDPVIDPDATVVEDTTDPNRYTVKVEVAHSSGAAGRKLTVEWGDGDAVEIDAAIGTAVSHEYVFDGDYLVRVRYSDGTGRTKYLDVTVPFTNAEGAA